MGILHELADVGQSMWLDYARHSFIESADFESLVDRGLKGMTFNPSALKNAIAGGQHEEEDLLRLTRDGKSLPEIYEAPAIRDVPMAADVLNPIYGATRGSDEYMTLEISREATGDTEGARRHYGILDRPKVMIKVPVTGCSSYW